ncbi:MAG: TraI domain-containing protein [Nitrospirae bacterium]|nr:TraI domain-containing protein [Nitrospirota bacterium]
MKSIIFGARTPSPAAILPSHSDNPFSRLPENIRITAGQHISTVTSILVDNLADRLAESIIERYLRLVWMLPGSKEHHHSYEFGLFIHSLEVAVQSLKDFEGKLFLTYKDGIIDSFETRRIKPREQYAYFLAGLLHDVGKAAEYIVRSEQNNTWNPLTRELYDFCGLKDSISIQKRETNYSFHEKISPFLASRLLSDEDYSYLGPSNVAELCDFLSKNPTAGNKFRKIIRSDMKSVNEDITVSAPKVDIIASVVDEIADMITSGKYSLNSNMSGAWILDEYTAVSFKVCDDARISAYNRGKTNRLIDSKVLLKGLTERRYVKAEEWKCIYTMDIEMQGRPFQQKVIQFKNAILWKNRPTPEKCRLNLKFNVSTKD